MIRTKISLLSLLLVLGGTSALMGMDGEKKETNSSTTIVYPADLSAREIRRKFRRHNVDILLRKHTHQVLRQDTEYYMKANERDRQALFGKKDHLYSIWGKKMFWGLLNITPGLGLGAFAVFNGILSAKDKGTITGITAGTILAIPALGFTYWRSKKIVSNYRPKVIDERLDQQIRHSKEARNYLKDIFNIKEEDDTVEKDVAE